MFTAKTRHFQGCLRVWSRGHQVRGHPGKLGKFAISKLWVKNNPSKLRLVHVYIV